MMSRLYRRTGYFSICNILEHKTPWGNLGIILFDWEGSGEIGFYKFAFSKLVYLILPESSDLLDSGGEHKTDCQINDALKCSPAAPSLPLANLLVAFLLREQR